MTQRPIEPTRPDPAMLAAFLPETDDDPPPSRDLLISPGAGVYLPVPSRWMAIPVVEARMEVWSRRRKNWITEPPRATWEPKGHAYQDLEILLRLEEGWEPSFPSYLNPLDGNPLTQKEVQAEIARMVQVREEAFRLPTQPTGPCWAALTPQGPILIQTTPEWILSWDGSLIPAYQTGSGSVSLLPSVLQVIQMEPVEEDQAQHWAHWAYMSGDFYLIP